MYKLSWVLKSGPDSMRLATKVVDTSDSIVAYNEGVDVRDRIIVPGVRAQGFDSGDVELHIDEYDPQVPLFPDLFPPKTLSQIWRASTQTLSNARYGGDDMTAVAAQPQSFDAHRKALNARNESTVLPPLRMWCHQQFNAEKGREG